MTHRLDRYIKTIYLAASPIREEMLESLLENVLYIWNEPIPLNKICELIKEEFSLEPIKDELQEGLNRLVEARKVIHKNNTWRLTDEAKKALLGKELKKQAVEESRYNNYTELLPKLSSEALDETEYRQVWKIFNEYLIDCFRIYAHEAINMFLPYNQSNGVENGDKKVYQNHLSFCSSESEKNVFERLVISYSLNLKEADLKYLDELASLSESFFSLGLPKEEYEKISGIRMFGWTLVADTNFLYSVLGLRPHPENEACLEILRLANTKEINIKIVYFPETLRELNRNSDFSILASCRNFTTNQIKALLAANQLDATSKAYYENKLSDSTTPHPAQIVGRAQEILKSKGIEIYNSKHLQNLSAEENGSYMVSKYQEFASYERLRNEARVEKGLQERVAKDTNLVEHDVLLREGILAIRDSKIFFADVKHYGISLDETLIKFDQYSIRKQHSGLEAAPTIFKPSFLLRKFRVFLPVNTSDYQNAFLRAISSKTYEPKKKYSIAAQASVEEFRRLGIDNEELMFDCISKDVFLNDLQIAQEKGEGKIFVESELNKRYEEQLQEQQIIQRQLDIIAQDKRRIEEEKEGIIEENQLMRLEKTDKEAEINSFKRKLDKVTKKVKSYENSITNISKQIQIGFEDKEKKELVEKVKKLEEENKKAAAKQKQRQLEDFYKQKVRKWRKDYLIKLFIGTIVLMIIISIALIRNNYDFIGTLQFFYKDWGASVSGIYVSIAGKFGYDRFWSHSNIENFKKSLPIPDHLTD